MRLILLKAAHQITGLFAPADADLKVSVIDWDKKLNFREKAFLQEVESGKLKQLYNASTPHNSAKAKKP